MTPAHPLTCNAQVHVISTAVVEQDGIPTGVQPPGGARKPPLLLIELQISKDGTKCVGPQHCVFTA